MKPSGDMGPVMCSIWPSGTVYCAPAGGLTL